MLVLFLNGSDWRSGNLGNSEMFKMSGILLGNPGADLDPRLDFIIIRLQTVKS